MAIKSLKKTTIKMSSRIYNYLKKNRYKITPVAYCVFTRGLTRGAFEFVFILHMTTGGGEGVLPSVSVVSSTAVWTS